MRLSLIYGALLALSAPVLAATPAEVERGRQLATAADCEACHTLPGQPLFSGGNAFATPFGTVHAPNITPDRATGIGAWTYAEFARALREGIGRGGEHLYPAFPYAQFTKLSDADVLAIKAYLFSLPPVRMTAPANTMTFPFGFRPLLAGWKWLNFTPGRFRPEPGKDAQYNRGKYLGEALGHCNECHTPRNLTLGLDGARNLGGGKVLGWDAYNITPDPVSGIGAWSNEDIAAYLATGRREGHAVAAGPMAEVVGHSLSKLPREDLLAMATWLQGQAPVRDPEDRLSRNGWGRRDPDRRPASHGGGADGRALYVAACASCHGIDGGGTPSLPGRPGFPPLVGTSALGARSPDNLVLAVVNGIFAHDPRGASFMPAFGPASTTGNALSDAEIAAVATYAKRQFGNPAGGAIDAAAVRRLRLAPEGGSPLVWAAWAGMALLLLGTCIAAGWRLIHSRRKGKTPDA